MRPRVLLTACCLGLALAAGACGGGGSTVVAPAPRALAHWSFPRALFIPQVAAVPAPVATPAPTRPPRERAPRTARIAPGAPSDAEVRAELAQLYGSSRDGGLSRSVTLDQGLAQAPPDAPAAVQRIVAAANQVARLPYVYGGGHGTFVDSAYDCSGSVSFALANAGLLDRPEASTALESFGAPGPGRWVTVYANAGHAFMVVGGARFDTVGLSEAGSRWQPDPRPTAGFVVRHPPGL